MLDWADLLDLKGPLFSYRKKAWERFSPMGLPTRENEAFRYLNRKLDLPTPATCSALLGEPQEGLVFVDGFFVESLSRLPRPLVVQSLEKAIRSYGLFLQARLTKGISQEADPLALLNGAFMGSGAFLYIPPQCKAVLHFHHHQTQNALASPRLHVFVGRGAEVQFTQTRTGDGGCLNGFFDLVLDQGAQCRFIDQARGDFQAIRAQLKRDSRFKAVFLGEFLRTSVNVELSEENSEAELYGLRELQESQEAHIHACLEHQAPHTHSRQHVKSILKGQSRFSFEGKIYVHPEAQKTEAYQLSNTLLLSSEAASYAKPNLEIFADDVKASHGATVGQLDEEELFYLRSRGLSLETARSWLIQGFAQEILAHVHA